MRRSGPPAWNLDRLQRETADTARHLGRRIEEQGASTPAKDWSQINSCQRQILPATLGGGENLIPQIVANTISCLERDRNSGSKNFSSIECQQGHQGEQRNSKPLLASNKIQATARHKLNWSLPGTDITPPPRPLYAAVLVQLNCRCWRSGWKGSLLALAGFAVGICRARSVKQFKAGRMQQQVHGILSKDLLRTHQQRNNSRF